MEKPDQINVTLVGPNADIKGFLVFRGLELHATSDIDVT